MVLIYVTLRTLFDHLRFCDSFIIDKNLDIFLKYFFWCCVILARLFIEFGAYKKLAISFLFLMITILES